MTKNPDTDTVIKKTPSPWYQATEFLGGVVCGMLIGYVIEQKHWVPSPWGMAMGLVLGFSVGVWNVWKAFQRFSSRSFE